MTERSDSAELVERIEELERIFSANPRTIEFITLADALLRADRYRQAYDVLRTGLRYRPDHVEARVLLGEALIRAGRLRAATREVAQVLRTDQHHIGALLVLARALALDNRADEARVILKRARSKAPSDDRIGMIAERLEDPEALQAVNLPGLVRRRSALGYLSQSGSGDDHTDVSSISDVTASVIIDQSYAWELAEMPPPAAKKTSPGVAGDTSIEQMVTESSETVDDRVVQPVVEDDDLLERTVPVSLPIASSAADADDTMEVSSPFVSSESIPTLVVPDDEETIELSDEARLRRQASVPPPAVRPLVPARPSAGPLGPSAVQARDTEPSMNEPSSENASAGRDSAAIEWESVLTGPSGLPPATEDGDTAEAAGFPVGLDLAFRERAGRHESVPVAPLPSQADVRARDTPKMGFGPPSTPPRAGASAVALPAADATLDHVREPEDARTGLEPSLAKEATPRPLRRRSMTVRGPLGGARGESKGPARAGAPSVPSSAVAPVATRNIGADTPNSQVDQHWFDMQSRPPGAQAPARKPDSVRPKATMERLSSKPPKADVLGRDWLDDADEELADDADTGWAPDQDQEVPRRRARASAFDGAESAAGRVLSAGSPVTPRVSRGPSEAPNVGRRPERSHPMREEHPLDSTVGRPQTVPLPKRRLQPPVGRDIGARGAPGAHGRSELNTPTPASVRREPVVSGGPPPRRAPSKAPEEARVPPRKKKQRTRPPRLPEVSNPPRRDPPALPADQRFPPIPEVTPQGRSALRASSPPQRQQPPPVPPARSRAPHQRFDHVVETVAGPSLAEMTPPPSPWGRVASLTTLIATLILALVVTLRYRTVITDLEKEHHGAIAQIADGNYVSRVEVATALAVPIEEPGFLARVGDATARLLGRSGFAAALANRDALLTRVEAERVLVYGDQGRLETARALLAKNLEVHSALKDVQLAAALLALAEHAPDKAARALDVLSESDGQSADAHWGRALVAEAKGDFSGAVGHVEKALQQDDRHPHAAKLLVDLRIKSENDAVGALHDYQRLLTQDNPGHIGAQISLERLRIKVRKRPGEAVESLKRLLATKVGELSPAQRALVHDSVGLYHLQEEGDEAQARKAYTAARDAAPGDSRFVVGLARLDMQAYDLAEAEGALERAIKSDPGTGLYKTMLAEIDLLRGDASGAVRRLSSIVQRDATANLLLGRAHLARAVSPTSSPETRAEGLSLAQDALDKSRSQSPNLVDAEALGLLVKLLQGQRRETQFRALADLRQRPNDSQDIVLDPAIKYRTYARALAARGRARRAKDAFAAVLHAHPRDFQSQFGICEAEMKRLRAAKALAACQKVATEMNPFFAPARQRWAEIAEFLAKPAVVSTALIPLREQGLAEPGDLRRLGRAFVAQEKHAALDALTKSSSDGIDEATQTYLSGLLEQSRGDLSAANALLSQSAQGLAGDSWAQTAYGHLLLQTGQSTKAMGFFRRAMDLSRAPMGALGLAQAHMQKREWRRAASTARRAEIWAGRSLVRKQVRGEALALQAQAAAQQGRRGRRKAKRLLNKAKKIDPSLPAVVLTEGLLAEQSRKRDDAIDAYRRLTAAAPKDPEGYFRLGRLLLSDRQGRMAGQRSLETVVKLDPQGAWGDRARRLLEKRR